jgi:hypothetical protein
MKKSRYSSLVAFGTTSQNICPNLDVNWLQEHGITHVIGSVDTPISWTCPNHPFFGEIRLFEVGQADTY